jgi:transcriptional regulator with XRE-family HTH domain
LEAPSHPLAPFVGAIVRTLRLSLGWSQDKLALEARVGLGAKIYSNQISLLERAERNSTLPTLEPVALALGVTCAGLIWQAEMLRDRVERAEEAKMKK